MTDFDTIFADRRLYYAETGNLLKKSIDECYWLEIVFVFIGLAVVVVSVFVGLGRIDVGALESTIAAVGSLLALYFTFGPISG